MEPEESLSSTAASPVLREAPAQGGTRGGDGVSCMLDTGVSSLLGVQAGTVHDDLVLLAVSLLGKGIAPLARSRRRASKARTPAARRAGDCGTSDNRLLMRRSDLSQG